MGFVVVVRFVQGFFFWRNLGGVRPGMPYVRLNTKNKREDAEGVERNWRMKGKGGS